MTMTGRITIGDFKALMRAGAHDRSRCHRTREGHLSHIDPTTLSDGWLLDLLDYPHVPLPERIALDEEAERRWPYGRPDPTGDNGAA